MPSGNKTASANFLEIFAKELKWPYPGCAPEEAATGGGFRARRVPWSRLVRSALDRNATPATSFRRAPEAFAERLRELFALNQAGWFSPSSIAARLSPHVSCCQVSSRSLPVKRSFCPGRANP